MANGNGRQYAEQTLEAAKATIKQNLDAINRANNGMKECENCGDDIEQGCEDLCVLCDLKSQVDEAVRMCNDHAEEKERLRKQVKKWKDIADKRKEELESVKRGRVVGYAGDSFGAGLNRITCTADRCWCGLENIEEIREKDTAAGSKCDYCGRRLR